MEVIRGKVSTSIANEIELASVSNICGNDNGVCGK